MNHFKLLAEQVHVQPLIDALSAKPHLWDAFTERQSYPGSAHADTRSIIVYGPETMGLWEWFNVLEVKAYPAFDELGIGLLSVLRLMRLILQPHRITRAGRVMITELMPYGKITPHVDEGDYAAHFQRLHLTLSGSCEFHCGDETITMVPGELWWFYHHAEHWAENESDEPRINLILDVVLDPALRA